MLSESMRVIPYYLYQEGLQDVIIQWKDDQIKYNYYI